ncbi:MAG: pilus assembly protein PilM [Candidatus Brennerbacteria bacterium]|nr:pilus assembly protein PilM [Candidatus Brennerbacteria bacterium]
MRLGFLDFFKDIANFVKAGSVLGVDFGTTSVKMVEVAKKGERFELRNYGILSTKKYLEHPNQAVQTASLEIVEKEAVELLRILLNEVKPKSKTVLASIPAFSSFVVPLEMPLLSVEETEKSVAFQAKQYIPLPPGAVSLDWIKVEEFESDRGVKSQRLLLVGIPSGVIGKYKNIFKTAGLRLVALELETLATARALGDFGAPTLLVDVGGEATSIGVIEKGALKHLSVSDYGGIHLTQALSRSLGLSIVRAEELKRRRGLTGKEGETELSTLILPFLDVIIQETRYARDSYERRYGRKTEKLVLVGGGANLLGIEKYFGNQMNLPTALPNTLNGFGYPPDLEPAVKNLERELPVAIGLAKRYF